MLKKILCWYFGICFAICAITFAIGTVTASDESQIASALMTVVCVVAAYFLIKAARKQSSLSKTAYKEDKIKEGDLYYTNKKREADEYYQQKKDIADQYLSSLKKDIDHLKKELEVVTQENIVKMVQVETYKDLRSDEIKNKLTILRGEMDESVRVGSAVQIISAFQSKKDVNSQTKKILRCFNAECANIIGAVTVKNVDGSRGKIQRSYDALNKIFASDGLQISKSYLASKLEELSLVYAYMVKEEEEKEQRRAIREQMVEEEKVRREIERAKQKIEKEEAQFSNEVKKLMSYMQKAKDDIERKLYIDKIHELEEKLRALQADKENVLQREQNTRAGFVYIISNIGSFGEQIFKIGMTRRLEPMDRIAELSSASVPFPFDVHAMIFSDDAPRLEAVLHQHFDALRVNKVNQRKEFFRVDLDEIKKVVLENHNSTVKFVDIPDAVEYRETLKLEENDAKI